MADEPTIARSDRRRRWRTQVAWATWLLGFLVMLIAGVIGLVLKEGNELPDVVEVALYAGAGLIGISILVRDDWSGGGL